MPVGSFGSSGLGCRGGQAQSQARARARVRRHQVCKDRSTDGGAVVDAR
jgi:hypothetical protein